MCCLPKHPHLYQHIRVGLIHLFLVGAFPVDNKSDKINLRKNQVIGQSLQALSYEVHDYSVKLTYCDT